MLHGNILDHCFGRLFIYLLIGLSEYMSVFLSVYLSYLSFMKCFACPHILKTKKNRTENYIKRKRYTQIILHYRIHIYKCDVYFCQWLVVRDIKGTVKIKKVTDYSSPVLCVLSDYT